VRAGSASGCPGGGPAPCALGRDPACRAGAAPYGAGVYEHLDSLYRQAAERLETAGRVEEAAFVLADLLGQPDEAVALLERHGRWALAAELADGLGLAPDLVVRLWWRAGRRDRAVEVALALGAFAAAVERLVPVDPAAARELRMAWVQARRRAGDHLGAVEAAWPDERLRPTVAGDLRAALTLGGTTAGVALAYLLSERPSAADRTAAVRLLSSDGAADVAARTALAAALARLTPGADTAADRELCSAAARMLVRDAAAGDGLGPQPAGAALRALRRRADPLLAADLPALAWPAPADPLQVEADVTSGQLPVRDAFMLADGSVLVASGEAGLRLYAADGRVRARWPVPVHELVVADHGGGVLLVARRGEASELHRLDLTTRRLRRWVTLRVARVLDSFDGGVLVVLDADGLALLDATADQARVVWRELDRTVTVHKLARGPASLAALLSVPGTGRAHELWRWDLPAMTLRERFEVDLQGAHQAAVLARGRLATIHEGPEQDGRPVVRWQAGNAVPDERPLTEAAGAQALSSGDTLAISAADAAGTSVSVTTRQPDGTAARTRVRFPTPWAGASMAGTGRAGLRAHEGTVTVWDGYGRIVCIDPDRRRVRAVLHTRI
jgi:hypothetical protein